MPSPNRGLGAGQFETKQIPGLTSAGGGGLLQRMLNLGGPDRVTSPFTQSGWVHACMQVRARAASQTPVKLYRSRDPEAPQVTSGPLYDLLESPNPRMSQGQLWRLVTHYLDLTGECFLVLLGRSGDAMAPIRPGQVPEEIWPVRGDLVHLDETDLDPATKLPRQWRVEAHGGQIAYPAHAIAQIHFPDPDNHLRGIGPIQAAMRRIEIDYQAERFDEAIVRNGGVPGVVYQFPETATADQVKLARETWDEQVGDPSNHKRALLIDNGGEITVPGFSPAEMELLALREWNREEIMALFGVTKPLLGITDDVNRANAVEAKRVFWEDTMIPLQSEIAAAISHTLIREIRGPEAEYRLEFDRTNVVALQDDMDAKIDRTVRLFETGVMTFSEAAALAGWEVDEIEGGDERFQEPPTPDPSGTAADDVDETTDVGTEDREARFVPALESKAVDPLETAEARASYARAFDDGLVPFDRDISKAIARTFREYVTAQRRAIIDFAADGQLLSVAAGAEAPQTRELTEDELAQLLIDTDPFKSALLAQVQPSIAALLEEQARILAIDELEAARVLLERTDRFYLDFLEGKAIRISETVDTVQSLIRNALRRSLVDVPALGTLSDRIFTALQSVKNELNVMTDKLGTRAELIARTESTSIANGARLREMELQGLTESRWITARDGEVRDTHEDLDGEIRPLGELFAPGLSHPGDPQAEVGEVANCRCVLSPVVPDLEP